MQEQALFGGPVRPFQQTAPECLLGPGRDERRDEAPGIVGDVEDDGVALRGELGQRRQVEVGVRSADAAVDRQPPAVGRHQVHVLLGPGHGRGDVERHAGALEPGADALTGVVRAITDGEYTITGPQFTGMRCFMGRTAVLDTGAAEIVVIERNQEPWDRGVFTSVGIDPSAKRFLLLKSRMYFRPVFLPIAKGMVFCDAPGVGTSDWNDFEYRKLRRPIYPLDEFPGHR